MDYLPVFLQIKGRPCLVVGGGNVAARKVELLSSAGALVRVVSPELCDALEKKSKSNEIEHIRGVFDPSQLADVHLVVAATDDEPVNQAVHAAATARQLPVNVVDNPELCSFIVPSIIDRSPVMVAVSTGGASPVLARILRTRLEAAIPAAYGRLAELTARFRDRVKERFGSVDGRRRFWERILQGSVGELALSGQYDRASRELEEELNRAEGGTPQGEVYLVGAGPGNPDLLTFRALRLLQQAEVIVYDHLISPEVLNLARRDADRIYVGKAKANHAMRQENINDLLVRLAKEGKRVLRLKGGDPFIFGRGGEEIDTLSAHGIRFEVVPGITAAAGVAAYSGIPLTHRDYAQSCVFVTGHLKDGSVNLDWDGIGRPNQTLVIYMGLSGLEVLCTELQKHGLAAETPAAIVQQGTTANQKVVTGNLASLPGQAAEAKLQAPTLIIVGEVVRLHEKLAWFHPEAMEGRESAFIPHQV